MIFKPANLRKLDGFIDILDAMQHDPLRLEVTASRPGKRTEPIRMGVRNVRQKTIHVGHM